MLERNLAAFTEALGVENAPAVVYFSLLGWQSDQDRNEFITALTGRDFRSENAYGA